MIYLDDDIEEYVDEPVLEKKNFSRKKDFDGIDLGYPILYDIEQKRFLPFPKLQKNETAFLGWMLNYDDLTNIIDVLYRGFLMNDYVKFPMTLKPIYIQSYIMGEFQKATNAIIEQMPRIKKLKRLNLKMPTREHAIFIYNNLNTLIKNYEFIYGYEKAGYFKAQLTTSPFYINDNGIIKIFNMQTNELKVPDLFDEAYFLAYFSFLNKI